MKQTAKRRRWERAYRRRVWLEHPEIYAKVLKKNQEWRKRNKKHLAAYYRLRKTGCTSEQFQIAWKAQKGLCGICRKRLGKPCADHCHLTKKFRGLLCSRCNCGLGQFKDNVRNLKAAINWLSLGE